MQYRRMCKIKISQLYKVIVLQFLLWVLSVVVDRKQFYNVAPVFN